MFSDPCVCVRACVRACVCHNKENMPDEWQARNATQAILVGIAQPKKI